MDQEPTESLNLYSQLDNTHVTWNFDIADRV